MDVQRLLDVAMTFRADYDEGLHDKISAVATAYSNTVKAPSGESASAYDTAYNSLKTECESALCESLSPRRRKILKALGADDLVGSGLMSWIDDATSGGFNPGEAVKRLNDLQERAKSMHEQLSSLEDVLTELGFEPEELSGVEPEVEVSIPSKLFDDNLTDFSKETAKLNRALQDVCEVATGSRPNLDLKGIERGSVEIFLKVDLVSGAALITLVTAIVQLIKEVLDIRRSKASLQSQHAPKEVIDGMKEWEKRKVQEELVRIVDERIKASKADDARKNELRKALLESLKYLADRIDKGMDVDVVIDSTSDDKEEIPADTAKEKKQLEKAREVIEKNQGVVKEIGGRGEGNTLMLGERDKPES